MPVRSVTGPTRGAIIPSALPGPALDLTDLAARAAGLAEGARAANTRRAYAADWAHFTAWCAGYGLDPLPAEPASVGFYLTAHETILSVATLTRRLSAIAVAHRMTGHAMDTRHPAIRDVMRGLRRARGVAQKHAEALTVSLLRRVLAGCGGRLIDRRDQALLLLGFGAALRRSELVALDHADISIMPEGLRVTIRRSKGDQEGGGEIIAIGRTDTATCPVAAYANWIAAAKITEGAVFRRVNRHSQVGCRLSTEAIADIVQRRVAAVGLHPSLFSGHSMRAGFATSAAAAGIEERVIMLQTRHKAVQTVRRYIRNGRLFERNLSVEVGL